MKVRDILGEVSLNLRGIENSDTHTMVRDDLANSVVRIEELLTVFELRDLLDTMDFELDLTDLDRAQRKFLFRPFKNFLADRWDRLKDYPKLHYTETYDHPITQVCLELATAIAQKKIFYHKKNNNADAPELPREPLHRFELLMPGINFVNQVNFLNLHQQDEDDLLQLHHFILDEDLKIIHVRDCLEYAKQDLSLKHTSALHPIGTQIPLSKNNSLRVRYHSKAANNAWLTLEKIEKHIVTLNTIGGALRRLMIALRDAGIRGNLGGSDDVAAREVHKGIQDFYNYFTSLNPDLQTAIYGLKANEELSGLFEFIFKKLLVMAYYDNKVNAFYVSDYEVENTAYLSETEAAELLSWLQSVADLRGLSSQGQPRVFGVAFSCVDQMSMNIKDMLGQNLPLFQLTPTTTDVALGLLFSNADNSELDPELTKLERELTGFLTLAAAPSLIKFTKEDVLKAAERSALFLDDNTQFLKKFSRKVITTPRKLFQSLNYLRCADHRDFIAEHVKTQALNRLFDNAEDLLDNFMLLNLVNKKQNENTLDIIIRQMGEKKLQRLFASKDDLKMLAATVGSNTFVNILQNWLTADGVKKMFENDDEIRRFIADFTEPQQEKLCAFLSIQTPTDAAQASSSSEPKRYTFFSTFSKALKLKLRMRNDADDQDEKAEEKDNKRQRIGSLGSDSAGQPTTIWHPTPRRAN